jgi:hypothetical protein
MYREIMKGNIVSVESFLQRIRNFDSPNREALPQRSQRDIIIDSLRQARDVNSNLYLSAKDNFIDDRLFKNYPDIPGIYFFLKLENSVYNFFYIGISGTIDGQLEYLRERLRKHMITFDYFFYTLAFPNNYQTYYDDCIRFYGSGIYKGKMKTYKRQFEAIDKVKFNYIAWIGGSDFDIKTWDAVESHFITTYKPPANGSKLNKKLIIPPLSHYKSKFEETKNHLFNTIIPQLGVELNG